MRYQLLPPAKSVEGWDIPSAAFFCKTCGNLWAKLERPGQPWIVYTVACADHELDRRFTVSGSVIQSWLHDDYLLHATHSDLMLELETIANFALRQLGEPT